MNRKPLVRGRRYLLKLATSRVPVHVREIVQVLDAGTLDYASAKEQVRRYEVAECVLETHRPIAFDLGVNASLAPTGRFVLVDQYEIAGGGIITEYVSDSNKSLLEHIKRRDYAWMHGSITSQQRFERHGLNPRLVVITGSSYSQLMGVGRRVENFLFEAGENAYYFGLSNLVGGMDTQTSDLNQLSQGETREKNIQQLGEIAHFLTDAGSLVITVVPDLDSYEASALRILTEPIGLLTVRLGEDVYGVDVDLAFSQESKFEEVVEVICRNLYDQGEGLNQSK